ncbi:EcsC family protein [Albibacterium profundi]|uniref:EcsC family protein n=1 Tax=Albibacterium profundi TaxID=3134906 RepID=A0ABV5CC47_9SPHI
MTPYEERITAELSYWQMKMQKKASLTNRFTKKVQVKLNNMIPEKVHQGITYAIEKMVNGVLFGTKYITPKPKVDASFQLREAYVKKQIKFYQKTASVEGAVTGAGGLVMGFVDFPAFLAIKMKMLFEVAALYGYNVKDFKERLFILYIFQLTFSSQEGRNKVYKIIADWDHFSQNLPEDIDSFDWRTFQQEYRDYIDLAKLAQLVPIIGAAVGAVANYQLVKQLGRVAMNCYRMRHFKGIS